MTSRTFLSTTFVALLTAAGLAGPALADGPSDPPPPPPPPPPPVISPTWDGFYAGLAFGSGSFEQDFGDNGTISYDADVYGGQVGYLRDLGAVLVGGELQYVIREVDAVTAPIDDGSSTRLKGMLAYDGGRIMPFAFVGLTQVDALGDQDSGITYGAGAELRLGNRVRAGIEYVVDEVDDIGGAEYSSDEVLLRLNYQF